MFFQINDFFPYNFAVFCLWRMGHKSINPRVFFLENWQSAESWYRWNNILLVYSTVFFYSLPVKTSPISACHRIVHSWYTNTPITGVGKKNRCSRLLLLRPINIDNYFAFSIFKPSCNLFVLLKKKLYLFSSPGHRPCELLSWVSVRHPSVR